MIETTVSRKMSEEVVGSTWKAYDRTSCQKISDVEEDAVNRVRYDAGNCFSVIFRKRDLSVLQS